MSRPIMSRPNDRFDHRRRERVEIGDSAIGGFALALALLLFGFGTALYVYFRD